MKILALDVDHTIITGINYEEYCVDAPTFFAPFFELATHLSATVCQLSRLNTSFIMRPSACVRLNTSDMIFRDSLLHFCYASILKNHRTALSHSHLQHRRLPLF